MTRLITILCLALICCELSSCMWAWGAAYEHRGRERKQAKP